MIYFNTIAKLKNIVDTTTAAELYSVFQIPDFIQTTSKNIEFKQVAVIYALCKQQTNSTRMALLSRIIKAHWPQFAGIEQHITYNVYPTFKKLHDATPTNVSTTPEPKKVEQSLDSLF